MSRPDEGLIHQWLDGECTPEESARLERLVATDAEWAAAVAEARGLMAASSRILGALDAVPHAAPAGAKAAPAVARRGFRVAPWMGVAAGLVLVAGTAYVLREQSRAPFGVVSSPSASPTMMDTAAGVQIGQVGERDQPPSELPPVGVARPAAAAAAAEAAAAPAINTNTLPSGAGAAGVAMDVVPPAAPPPAPPAAAQRAEADAAARRAAELAAEQERARTARATRAAAVSDESRTTARQAPARAAAPTAAPMVASPIVLPALDGCWRVSAPPELVGVLVTPTIRRAAGDTLVLVMAAGDFTVVRVGDVLRGGLEAKQEPCRIP